jgi:four helix bundle protein
MDLVTEVYELTGRYPKKEMYGITNQLGRAAVSVPSNIAEGAARSSLNERRRFYEIARSSLVEINTQLEISKRLVYFPSESNSELNEQINHLFAMLSKMIERILYSFRVPSAILQL